MASEFAYLRAMGIERGPDYGEVECPECRGSGFYSSDNGPAPREYDCEDCGGSGYVPDDDAVDETPATPAELAALRAKMAAYSTRLAVAL